MEMIVVEIWMFDLKWSLLWITFILHSFLYALTLIHADKTSHSRFLSMSWQLGMTVYPSIYHLLSFSFFTPVEQPSARVKFLLGDDADEVHESHEIFTEMEELYQHGDDEMEWKETAR